MLTIITVAAIELTAPSPVLGLSFNDYPTWAMEQDASAASVIHVVVDPGGRVIVCNVTREFGNPRLAKDICSIVKRKRLRPATLRDGQRVHAVLDTFLSLFIPDTDAGKEIMTLHQKVRIAPDAELSVNKLPDGSGAEAAILLAYDESGKVTDCGPTDGEKNLKLAGIACSQSAMFDGAVQRIPSGQPVPYITRKKILFTIDSSK